jgi:hypothetical protein
MLESLNGRHESSITEHVLHPAHMSSSRGISSLLAALLKHINADVFFSLQLKQ